MKVIDGRTGTVFVGRDASGFSIEVETRGSVLLTADGARRLAAVLLFEAAKLEPSQSGTDLAPPMRKSA